ncbi:MAG: DUF2065 domain-containing protein [Nitrospinota bacterium]|nr:DUF2065 domain-containing protein [Nitrospinota bacterium]
MSLFISAIGLMMVFEGVPFFCFPEKVKEIAQRLREISNATLRSVGFCLIILGLLVAYLGRNTI